MLDPRHRPMSLVAPGVAATTDLNQGALIITKIAAITQGTGDVGRYLAACQEKHHTVIVLACISPRLAGMMARRGFVNARDDDWIWRSPLAPDPKGLHDGR